MSIAHVSNLGFFAEAQRRHPGRFAPVYLAGSGSPSELSASATIIWLIVGLPAVVKTLCQPSKSQTQ